MSIITSRPFFALPDGRHATLYTLKNSAGMEVEISDFGGCIVAIRVPDRTGKFSDVVLGYDNYEGYCSRKYFFGATIGRCANRMAGGHFVLRETEYQLYCNENGVTHLHGGRAGFDVQLWQAEIAQTRREPAVLRLRYHSADGEEGYPGNLKVSVSFLLTELGELSIHYEAVCDRDTLCNLTNHSYFNLAGHIESSILDHQLRIHADYYTEIDQISIPTGQVLPVKDTPMDFTSFRLIGERIDENCPQLKNGSGYDHNFVVRESEIPLRACAEVYHEASGRFMTCLTTSPCVQLYTGNFLDGTQKGKWGVFYPHRSGFCLETQFAPDAVHHPDWKSPILRAGEMFDHTTVYRFGIK